jgi:hypothetical protein
MGYSYAIRCKDKDTSRKMLHFLAIMEPQGKENNFYFTAEPAYCSGKNIVGLDHGPISTDSHILMASILRWVAIKVGMKKTMKSIGDFAYLKSDNEKMKEFGKISVPYIDYDSQYLMPVLLRSQWQERLPKEMHYHLCNEIGIFTEQSKHFSNFLISKTFQESTTAAEAIVKNLDDSWSRFKNKRISK